MFLYREIDTKTVSKYTNISIYKILYKSNRFKQIIFSKYANNLKTIISRAAVVHLNFRAGSTFPVPVCTVPSSMDRSSRCNKVDDVRLYAPNRFNLLLLKGQMCVISHRNLRIIGLLPLNFFILHF